MDQLILYLIVGLLLTAVFYMAYPIIRLTINHGRFEKNKANKIALWNSIIVGAFFCIGTIATSDGTQVWSAAPAVLYYWINRTLLTQKTSKAFQTLPKMHSSTFNQDIDSSADTKSMYSLSYSKEKSSTYGRYNVYGNDIRLQTDVKPEAVDNATDASPIEGQKAIEGNRESQPHNELDADFGLVPQKPVYTVGIGEQEKYLKSLRTINGEPIKWNRRGSISVDGVNGMVDVYDTYLPSGEEYKTVYINMYGASNSTFAPKGFSYSNQTIATSISPIKKQNGKKTKKLKIALLITGVVAIVAILFFVFAIPEINYQRANSLLNEEKFDAARLAFEDLGNYRDSKEMINECLYQKACLLLDNGSYDSAISMFEDLDGYKKSERKVNEAKYGYVLKHKNNNDTTTFEYLKDLKKKDYKDSSTIYNNLYEWKVTGIISADSDNYTRHENSISKYCDYVHASFTLTGGTPGEIIDVTHTTIYPDGETHVSDWHWYGKYDNSSFGCEWSTGFYNNPQYGDTGTFVIKIYNLKTGEFIGSVTTKITD